MKFKKTIAVIMAAALIFSGLTAFIARAEEAETFPLRAAFEAQGHDVLWLPYERAVVITLLSGEAWAFLVDTNMAWVQDMPVELATGVHLVDSVSMMTVEDNMLMNAAHMQWLAAQEPFGLALGHARGTAESLLAAGVAGMTMALVCVDSGFVWAQGFGTADANTGRPVDEHSMFQLASVSKPFTALAVMQLYEQGVIDLDSPVVNYLPDFYQSTDILSGYGYSGNITIRQLLSHASGITPDLTGFGVATRVPYSGFMDNFLDTLATFPLSTPQAIMYAYANNAFTLLGILVATLATENDSVYEGFIQYMQENIFAPLGMANSTFYVTPEQLPLLAMGHRDGVREERIVYNFLPTGGLYSSAYDMALFMQAILTGGGDIIQPATLAQMFAHQDHGEGFDFGIYRTANMRPGLGFAMHDMWQPGFMGFTHWGHGGNVLHHHSMLALDIEAGLGFFMSINDVSGMLFTGTVPADILALAVFEKTGTVGRPSADVTFVQGENLEQFTGVYGLAGSPAFAEISLVDGMLYATNFLGMDGALVPLSDGSFLFLDIIRVWLDVIEEDGEEVVLVLLGEHRAMFVGSRLLDEQLTAPEGFDALVGRYVPVMPAGHVSLFTAIDIGITEAGIPYMLVQPEYGEVSNAISSILFIDGQILGFDAMGDGYFYMTGTRFERVN